MHYINRFFRFLFSRQVLLVVALLLAVAAVWFLGPLLAFGVYYPLATAGARVLVIVVLLTLLLFWLLRWPTLGIWLALLGVAFWYASPLLAFGEAHPFKSTWARALVIIVLAVCYLAFSAYRLWRAMRSDDALLQRVLHPFGQRSADQDVARDEVRAVNATLDRALAKLRRMRGALPLWRRLFESQRYLYELPWYVVIGSSGAGKTQLILNSGLDFPDQMDGPARDERTATLDCDCWFSNEAVLVDTAGRYALQNTPRSDEATAADEEDAAAIAAARSKANAAEWKGFLSALRKRRPRAPVNGTLLVVSVEELLKRSTAERVALAAALRARLGDLREQLGVRFPVYVLVNKLDLLPGFSEYFQALSPEGRTQVLGFTLPYQERADLISSSALRTGIAKELQQLEQRLEAGINLRLQEEYELERRRKLYALPGEFRCFAAELAEWIGMVFLDSRYDDTQLHSALRGVYFASAAQTHEVVPANRHTLLQRLRRGFAGLLCGTALAEANAALPTGHRGYFLRDLFKQVILAEGHLVRPNLRWEFRFRALRTVGHLLSVAVAVWLIGSLTVSFGNNHRYLKAIDGKADVLINTAAAYNEAPQDGAMATMLNISSELPQYLNLDLDSPGSHWRYGLYIAPRIQDASDANYTALLRQTLLPRIVDRVEAVLGMQVDTQDADATYRTLTVYLSLYDHAHYDAAILRTWVWDDWQQSPDAAPATDRNALEDHLNALFAEDEPVTPRTAQRDDLVQRARELLARQPEANRLYERAMMEMRKSAPDNITLLRAAGPRSAAVFGLAANSSLQDGVPGMYTYEGYHEVFDKQLSRFLQQAEAEDAWVMGKASAPSIWTSTLRPERDKLADAMRRLYLTDYGNYWQRFMEDIRPANVNGGSLTGELQTLRVLSAPDSPLTTLAQTLVRETSLTAVKDETDDSALTSAALDEVTRRSRAGRLVNTARTVAPSMNLAQVKMEKELVDNRFAALRQVVTGSADTGKGPAPSGSGTASSGVSLGSVMGLLNEQYNRLSMADSALATNGMPGGDDLGTTLALQASRLPAPLNVLLEGVASRSMRKVNQGVGSMLARQVESSVGDQCRSLIEGRYPFAKTSQDVDIDDFARVFAPGGMLDNFFQQSLASHVDTSVRPWRYKPVGPGMPPFSGPSLQPFEQAAAIREAFFQGSDAKHPSWKGGIKVVALDPEITDLTIDIDGQSLRYAHGPVTVSPMAWPGPRGGAVASITANPRVRPDTSTLMAEGPWALFRLIDRGHLSKTASSSRFTVDFDFDGRRAVLELVGSGQANPQSSGLLKNFRCPGVR